MFNSKYLNITHFYNGLFFSLFLLYSISSAFSQPAMPAPQVEVAVPLVRKISLWEEYTGRLEAVDQVDIRARVSGFVEKIHFHDGQLVNKGDMLFTIDQRPYIISLEAAKADVAKAQAQLRLANNEVERAQGLSQSQAISVRDIDTRKSNLSIAQAILVGAEANMKSAALNLEWTEIKAPISGRVSDRKVDAGNLIAGGQAGATLLTTLVSQNPVYAIFEASEAQYLRHMKKNDDNNTRIVEGRVEMRLTDEMNWGHPGKVEFLDNQFNPRSGTIRVRAVFSNDDQKLKPGLFSKLRIFGDETEELFIPDAAIVSDQSQKIVFVLGEDNKVLPRVVTIGSLIDGLRLLRSGVGKQDKIIINGLASPMVRPGVVVSPQQIEIKVGTKS